MTPATLSRRQIASREAIPGLCRQVGLHRASCLRSRATILSHSRENRSEVPCLHNLWRVR
jgi:hypothetical protein